MSLEETHDEAPTREPENVHEEQVTPLELFFDLVFVFAITQVTAAMSADPSWRGLARGMLVLAAIWWAWVGYAWLTNNVDPEDERVRVTVFGVMATMLVVSLAVPGAFDKDAYVFGVAYLIVRVAHIALYAFGVRGSAQIIGAIRRLAVTSIIGPLIIIGAASFDGATQGALWAVALLIDYLGGIYSSASSDESGHGWEVHPRHFAERHGLIVIIALGESIVAIGAGAAGIELGAGVIAAAVLGVAVSAALWWAYFDVVAIVAERKLHEAEGREQATLARDVYSYLHLPLVAGIVLFSLGAKKTLAHVGDPLEIVPAVGLCGGVGLYYLGHIAFRYRNIRTINRQRLIAAFVLFALIPAAAELDALVSLALVAAVCLVLVAYEAITKSEARHRIRDGESAVAVGLERPG